MKNIRISNVSISKVALVALPITLMTNPSFSQQRDFNVRSGAKMLPPPNILWLTFEDTSWYEFGCYGNQQVHTPTIDSLAREGVLFTNAWASAPQSSPARSSLITGCYAPTYAMDWHAYRMETPEFSYFPAYLKERGYYCTNNHKTHYNSKLPADACWDECGKKATYNSPDRRKNQPFFSVFNAVTSHMGRVRTIHTQGRRDYSKEGLEVNELSLPEHLPDLPEMRSDYAAHLEGVQDIDKWVKIFLDDLKSKGLDSNTIVFVFSDHGGCLPRGKGYVYETGLRVPMVMYVPDAYKSYLGVEKGSTNDKLVNFVDLGPTAISIAGGKPPKHMQGIALYGKYASKDDKKIDYAFGANQLHHILTTRASRNHKYKYIRSYLPYRQFALRNYYQWGMPSNQAWDRLILDEQEGKYNLLSEKEFKEIYKQPYAHHSAEMLFDIENDVFEVNDLASNPEYKSILESFRKDMDEHIRKTKDLGFFIPTSRKEHNLYDFVRNSDFPLEAFYTLVEKAGYGKLADYKIFEDALDSKYPDFRFWGIVGLAQLAVQSSGLDIYPKRLVELMDDSNPYISAEAALACAYISKNLSKKAIHLLATKGDLRDRKVYLSALECISLDKDMRELIKPEVTYLLRDSKTLPDIKNEDPGMMVRGILANLGVIEIKEIYNKEAHAKGLKLNRGRRPIAPLPNN